MDLDHLPLTSVLAAQNLPIARKTFSIARCPVALSSNGQSMCRGREATVGTVGLLGTMREKSTSEVATDAPGCCAESLLVALFVVRCIVARCPLSPLVVGYRCSLSVARNLLFTPLAALRSLLAAVAR